MSTTVQAKAKVRDKRKKAIENYKLWLQLHPMATTKERVDMFDQMMDEINEA